MSAQTKRYSLQVGALKAQAHKLTDEAAGEKVRLLQALHDGEQLRSRIVEVRCITPAGRRDFCLLSLWGSASQIISCTAAWQTLHPSRLVPCSVLTLRLTLTSTLSQTCTLT